MPHCVNLLLASLPRAAYAAILPGLTPVALLLGDVLNEPGEPVSHVYFPQTCLVSLIVVVEGALTLELALVGREGMVGVSLVLGASQPPMRALVQGAGSALRMNKAVLRSALRQSEPLQRALHGYTDALLGQVARTAGCNRYHRLEARLARWLLMTRDRVGWATS